MERRFTNSHHPPHAQRQAAGRPSRALRSVSGGIMTVSSLRASRVLPLRPPVRPRRAGLSPSSAPGEPGAPAPRHPRSPGNVSVSHVRSSLSRKLLNGHFPSSNYYHSHSRNLLADKQRQDTQEANCKSNSHYRKNFVGNSGVKHADLGITRVIVDWGYFPNWVPTSDLLCIFLSASSESTEAKPTS